MTAHGGVEFGAARTGFQFQFSVEREDFEKIAMRPRGRTGATVIAFTKIICALDPGSGRTVLGDSCRFRIDVPDDPMRKQTARRIRIIDNQDQRFRFIRDATDLQFRTDVCSVAGKFGRNIASGLKGRAGDRNRRSSIHIKSHSKENRESEPYRFHSCNLGRMSTRSRMEKYTHLCRSDVLPVDEDGSRLNMTNDDAIFSGERTRLACWRWRARHRELFLPRTLRRGAAMSTRGACAPQICSPRNTLAAPYILAGAYPLKIALED